MRARYAHADSLAETSWVAEHSTDAAVRVVEVDADTTIRREDRIPGAIRWSWRTELCDATPRDIVSQTAFEHLMEESGISNETTVVLYGGNDNWFAAWAFWTMKIYGHRDVRLVNGGRRKWLAEGRRLSREVRTLSRARYRAKRPDLSIRSFLPEVQAAVGARTAILLDVRSPEEFAGAGRALAPPGFSGSSERAGHITGACNVPWHMTCDRDGAFRPAEDLHALYRNRGITPGVPVITYCRIGARASHTWFVLRYLLGYADVKVYDGSWAEWGNLVRAPIECGA